MNPYFFLNRQETEYIQKYFLIFYLFLFAHQGSLLYFVYLNFFITDDCDFESKTICGYTQDNTDNFDWTRSFGGTASVGTGPANDHTYGTKSGMFIQNNLPRSLSLLIY